MPAASTTASGRAHEVWVGVDTHRDINVAVSLDERGRKLGELVVATTAAGNRELLAWARALGNEVRGFAVEGTGSYGASLTRHLQDAGEFVIEAGRPARRGDRQQRRARGKTDTIDAHRAARSLLAEELDIAPKARNGNVECLRIRLVAKRSAIKARTQAVQGMRALLVSAPDLLREQLRGASMERLIESCARLRLSSTDGVGAATKAALRHLARRCRHLTEELAELDAEIQRLVQATAPNLLTLTGVGCGIAAVLLASAGENAGRMRSEASFAHMTGVAPLPTGSGWVGGRHRLNKGGDRQANSALWRIVIVRMRVDPRTREYVARRTAEGLGKKEITRCLKRYVAREVYRELIAAMGPASPQALLSA
jgi:transposase